MYERTFMVETCKWDNDEKDFCEEKEVWDITGIQAIKLINEFLEKYPRAEEGRVACDPEDGMFISLREIEENGDEYWLSAYSREKEP